MIMLYNGLYYMRYNYILYSICNVDHYIIMVSNNI